MDHYSILDRSSASPAAGEDIAGASASRSGTASVSAGIAAANALVAKSPEPGPRFPGEDGGRSLAEMAYTDLDAALQLLAERAQYITGASGAAIALRRGEHNDMLCRASAGSNAPELGALLSMEYGLSGESVRTRQVLRCDDAERDARVNREVCHDLGIASVVVMPIVSEEQVLGVFELLSGKPRAFDERALSALQRLGEMVETAVKHAAAAQVVPEAPAMPPAQELELAEIEPPAEAIVPEAPKEAPKTESPAQAVDSASAPAAPPSQKVAPAEEVPLAKKDDAVVPKKPLFWSAALRDQGSTAQVEPDAESMAVPPGLRTLQKCQACGFPVSQGRTYCVECEEKQWRDQRVSPPAAVAVSPARQPETKHEVPLEPPVVHATPDSGLRLPVSSASGSDAPAIPSVNNSSSAQSSSSQATDETSIQTAAQTPPVASVPTTEAVAAELSIPAPAEVPETVPEIVVESAPGFDNSAPFLSSAIPSESWFAANKYILGALLVVAIVIGAIAWLH
jgi:hypothetical protein